MDTLFFLLTFVALCGIVWMAFHAHMHVGGKAFILLSAAILVLILRPWSAGFDHSLTLTIFGTLGLAVMAGILFHFVHNVYVRGGFVVIAIVLVAIRVYPHFVAGPAALMASTFPSAPAIAPVAPAYTPPPASRTASPSRSSRRAARGTSDPCLSDATYDAKHDLGCPCCP